MNPKYASAVTVTVTPLPAPTDRPPITPSPAAQQQPPKPAFITHNTLSLRTSFGARLDLGPRECSSLLSLFRTLATSSPDHVPGHFGSSCRTVISHLCSSESPSPSPAPAPAAPSPAAAAAAAAAATSAPDDTSQSMLAAVHRSETVLATESEIWSLEQVLELEYGAASAVECGSRARIGAAVDHAVLAILHSPERVAACFRAAIGAAYRIAFRDDDDDDDDEEGHGHGIGIGIRSVEERVRDAEAFVWVLARLVVATRSDLVECARRVTYARHGLEIPSLGSGSGRVPTNTWTEIAAALEGENITFPPQRWITHWIGPTAPAEQRHRVNKMVDVVARLEQLYEYFVVAGGLERAVSVQDVRFLVGDGWNAGTFGLGERKMFKLVAEMCQALALPSVLFAGDGMRGKSGSEDIVVDGTAFVAGAGVGEIAGQMNCLRLEETPVAHHL